MRIPAILLLFALQPAMFFVGREGGNGTEPATDVRQTVIFPAAQDDFMAKEPAAMEDESAAWMDEPAAMEDEPAAWVDEPAACTDEPAETIEKWLDEGFSYWQQIRDVPSLISYYAERQLGIAYVGGLLDEPDEEQLVVTLHGSDCVIYVEMSLALAITTLQSRTSYRAFRDNLKSIRYRDGQIDGYPSRLHYFSDWLLTNQQKGLLGILFQEKGLPAIEPPDFMTQNRENYRHLAHDDAMFAQIREMEDGLSGRQLIYIPQYRIPEFEDRLETGDILAFVSTIDGLDIAHTGLVRMDAGRAGFYHASLTGAVIVDPNTIHQYTANRRNINGIVVARLHSLKW